LALSSSTTLSPDCRVGMTAVPYLPTIYLVVVHMLSTFCRNSFQCCRFRSLMAVWYFRLRFRASGLLSNLDCCHCHTLMLHKSMKQFPRLQILDQPRIRRGPRMDLHEQCHVPIIVFAGPGSYPNKNAGALHPFDGFSPDIQASWRNRLQVIVPCRQRYAGSLIFRFRDRQEYNPAWVYTRVQTDARVANSVPICEVHQEAAKPLLEEFKRHFSLVSTYRTVPGTSMARDLQPDVPKFPTSTFPPRLPKEPVDHTNPIPDTRWPLIWQRLLCNLLMI
jgi:hypothetical protein